MNSNGLKSGNLIDDIQDNTKDNSNAYFSCLVSSDRNNINDNNNKENKKKKVKFTEKIIFIDVECWKKYNAEQTADENYYEINEEEINELKNKNNDNNNNKRNKKDNVFCTCNVV